MNTLAFFNNKGGVGKTTLLFDADLVLIDVGPMKLDRKRNA